MSVGDLVCISNSCHFKMLPVGTVALVIKEVKANESAMTTGFAKALTSLRESKYYFLSGKKIYGPVFDWELANL